MIGDVEKCEVAIVGAGPAGASCGYILAQAGVDVLILERGEYAGAKNMFGGIFFSDQMSKILRNPDFYCEAPVERHVAKRRYSMLVENSEIALTLELEDFKRPPYNQSFIVKRPVFDRWFAEKAAEQGATVLCGATVTDFLWNGDRVIGVSVGPGDENTLLADVVVCAEGANSILSEKAGLRSRLSSRSRCVSVKEVIGIPKDVIDERFGLEEREGAACEYFGDSVAGMLGDGFIYTNRESLSVGVTVLISELYARSDPISPNELLERFKSHPSVFPLIKGGQTLEYSAHMIPTDGYRNLPKLVASGLVLVGDAAGLVNNGFFHEGVNMAMASGMMAADAILKNRKKRRYDAKALRLYERLLHDSFVIGDMRGARDVLDILRANKEVLNEYPHAVKDALVKLFEGSDVPTKVLRRSAFDEIRGRVSFAKMGKILLSLVRGGI